jgi:hypothetical protein
MMPRADGTGQVINALSAHVTLLPLPGRFVLLDTAFHDSLGITPGTRSSFRPAPLAYALVPLGFSHQILDGNLQQLDSSHGFEKGVIMVPRFQIQAPGIQQEPILLPKFRPKIGGINTLENDPKVAYSQELWTF